MSNDPCNERMSSDPWSLDRWTWRELLIGTIQVYAIVIPAFAGVTYSVDWYLEYTEYADMHPEIVELKREAEKEDLFDRYDIPQPPPATKFDRSPEENRKREQEIRFENRKHGPY